jgi:hypothetical protein
VNGVFLVKVTAALQQTSKPSEIAALTRAFKTVIDIADQLSGRKAQREVFDARREENDYFTSIVQHYVDDPETARAMAGALRHRKAMIGFEARKAYKSQVDGVYRVGHVVSEAERAVDEVVGGD